MQADQDFITYKRWMTHGQMFSLYLHTYLLTR